MRSSLGRDERHAELASAPTREPAQLFSFHPVRQIQCTMAKHTTKNPEIAATLTPTFTSETP